MGSSAESGLALFQSNGIGYFVVLVVLVVLSAFLGAGGKKRRAKGSSRRKVRPIWQDLLAISASMTVFWVVLVGPSVISRPLNLDGFGEALSFGTLLMWTATVAVFAIGRFRGRYRFDDIRTINDLLLLPPDEFEHFVAHLFMEKGSQATVVGRGGDHGVDIIVESINGRRAIVQCKRWSGKWVDESVVRDLYGAMMHDGANTNGYLVTTSTFSEPARKWAEGKPITLIDGKRLAQAVSEMKRDSQNLLAD